MSTNSYPLHLNLTVKRLNFRTVSEWKEYIRDKNFFEERYCNQRPLMDDYVDQLIDEIRFYIEKFTKGYSIGSIIYAKYNNILYHIDGQHRLEAIKKLNDGVLGRKVSFPFEVTINDVEDKLEIDVLFKNLNKGLRAPDVIIDNLALSSIRNDIVEFITKQYRGIKIFVGKEGRVNRPNISIQLFIDSLTRNEELMNEIASLDDFLRIFNEYNTLHYTWLHDRNKVKRYNRTMSGRGDLSLNMVRRAEETGIYFCLVGDGDYFPPRDN